MWGTITLATTITGVQGPSAVGCWSTTQGTDGEAGGGWRQLGGNVAGDTAAAMQAAVNAHWRCYWHVEAVEEEEEESQARQEWR